MLLFGNTWIKYSCMQERPSLSRELSSVDVKDIQAGDLFIQGGHPGTCDNGNGWLR